MGGKMCICADTSSRFSEDKQANILKTDPLPQQNNSFNSEIESQDNDSNSIFTSCAFRQSKQRIFKKLSNSNQQSKTLPLYPQQSIIKTQFYQKYPQLNVLQEYLDDDQSLENIDIYQKNLSGLRKKIRAQFSNNEQYRRQLRLMKNRPEIIPHYLIQLNKIEQANQKQKELEQIQIQKQIDLNNDIQIEENDQNIEMKFDRVDCKYMSFQENNESKTKIDSFSSKFSQDGSQNSTKYQFKVKDYNEIENQENLRNFLPKQVGKNSSEFAIIVNNSLNYWNQTQDERNPVKAELNNVLRKKKYMCTADELDACLKISKAFKSYKLRSLIYQRVLSRQKLLTDRQNMQKIIQRSLDIANQAILQLEEPNQFKLSMSETASYLSEHKRQRSRIISQISHKSASQSIINQENSTISDDGKQVRKWTGSNKPSQLVQSIAPHINNSFDLEYR